MHNLWTLFSLQIPTTHLAICWCCQPLILHIVYLQLFCLRCEKCLILILIPRIIETNPGILKNSTQSLLLFRPTEVHYHIVQLLCLRSQLGCKCAIWLIECQTIRVLMQHYESHVFLLVLHLQNQTLLILLWIQVDLIPNHILNYSPVYSFSMMSQCTQHHWSIQINTTHCTMCWLIEHLLWWVLECLYYPLLQWCILILQVRIVLT